MYIGDDAPVPSHAQQQAAPLPAWLVAWGPVGLAAYVAYKTKGTLRYAALGAGAYWLMNLRD